MLSFLPESPRETLLGIAKRARDRRLARNLTQAGLVEKAQVSLGTLKLFERTGKVSLETLIRIAFALEAEAEFRALFPVLEAVTIDDIVAPALRQRGRSK